MPHTSAFRQLIHCLNRARRLNLQTRGRPVAKAISRRKLIKTGVKGGLLLAAMSALPKTLAADKKVVIIGAGLAGLNAAYQLKKAGIEAIVYEASSRAGGRVHTVIGQLGSGLETDLGGELVNSNHDDLLGLAAEFGIGLTSRIEPHDALQKVAFYFGGRLRNENEMAEALRPLAAQMMADAEALDADWDTHAPKIDALSVADYLDRHQALIPKDPNIRQLIESVVKVEYGVEAKDSSALQLLFALPAVDGEQVEMISDSDEAYVLNGGSESVIKSLVTLLDGQIRLNASLKRLEKSGEGFKLWINDQQSIEADYVVLTLPLSALRMIEFKVDLPENLHRFIQEVDLGRNEKIIAGVANRVWRQAKGFEIEAWSDQSIGLIWDSSLRQLEQREGALTYFLSAQEVDVSAAKSANRQGTELLREFDAIIPGLAQSGNGKFMRTAWHKMPGINGAYTNFKPGQYTSLAANWLWIESDNQDERVEFAVDNLVFAGEHTSDEYYGFMNGAAQSGRLAAQRVIRSYFER